MIKMYIKRIKHDLPMSGPTAQLHSGIQQAREFEDPPGLLEKTEFLLREWVTRFFCMSSQMCLDLCYRLDISLCRLFIQKTSKIHLQR